jgi:phosphatidate cytidylyltransferase
MAGDLRVRLGVAVFGIPAGLVLIYLGGWPLGVVLAVIAWLGTGEYYALAAQSGARPFRFAGMALAAAIVLLATWRPHIHDLALMGWSLTLVLALGSMAASVFRRGTDGIPLGSVSATVTGFLYSGATLAFIPLLAALPDHAAGPGPMGRFAAPALILFPLAVTWMGDSGAYFTGGAVGGPKLIPSVSPKKTVSGSIGGLVVSALAGAILAQLTLAEIPVWGLSWWQGALAGIVLGGIAQVADLAESVIKREAGVKDSGNLLPGHGGVLDRFDAILFTVPVTFVLLLLKAWVT